MPDDPSGSVLEGVGKGLVEQGARHLAHAWQRLLGKRQYAPVDDFPFEVLTVAELGQRLEAAGLLTCTANPFIRREWDCLHKPERDNRRVLLIAEAERGKTREAYEFVKALAQHESMCVLLPKTSAHIPAPPSSQCFPALAEHGVLFWDEIENAYPAMPRLSRVSPDGASPTQPHETLHLLLDQLEHRFTAFHFVATARQERRVARLPDLDPQSPNGLWREFAIVSLPAFTDSQEQQLVQDLARVYGLTVEPNACRYIAANCAGASAEALVLFFRSFDAEAHPNVTVTDAQESLRKRAAEAWRANTYEPLVRQNPDVEAIYRALRYLRVQLGVPAPRSLVLLIAAELLRGRGWRRRRAAREALRALETHGHLQAAANVLAVPDLQLEALADVPAAVAAAMLRRWRPRAQEAEYAESLGWALLTRDQPQHAVSLFQRLRRVVGASPACLRGLAVARGAVGDECFRIGDLPGALAEYRAALAIRERFSSADPANAQWQRGLSVSHNKIGDVLVAQGHVPGALAEYRAALAIRERLAAADPTNAQRQRDLAVSHAKLARAHTAAGDERTAAEHRATCREILQQMRGRGMHLDPHARQLLDTLEYAPPADAEPAR